MSYIGNQPTTVAFLTDQFSGNGSTVAFTMSVAPATTSSILVAITGVVQDPSTYAVSGTTLTFSAAPPSGTGNISIRYLGIPASGVTTTAYRTVTEFTATAGQTTFSVPSYTVGYIDVYRNGVMLGSADYTATSGTSVVLATAAAAGNLITTESFYVSSVLNALPATGGSLSGQLTINSPTGQKPFITQVNGTEVFEIDASGNVGVGTSTPLLTTTGRGNLTINGTTASIMTLGVNNSWCGYLYASGSVLDFASNSSPVTITAGGANYVGFNTNGTERARIDSSGNFQFNSGYGSPATAYGCRAWVNFNGTGTVAIRASGNVTSITDNGTGDYTVNFTTAMPDANYSLCGTARWTTVGVGQALLTIRSVASALTTSSARIGCVNSSGAALADFEENCISIFR